MNQDRKRQKNTTIPLLDKINYVHTSGFERESLRRLSKLLTARDTSLGVNDEHVITIGSHCAPEEYEPPQRRWMHKDIVRTVPISDSGHSSELVPAARSGEQPSFYEYIYRG